MSLITLKRFREFFKCLELFCKFLRGFEKVGLKDWRVLAWFVGFGWDLIMYGKIIKSIVLWGVKCIYLDLKVFSSCLCCTLKG